MMNDRMHARHLVEGWCDTVDRIALRALVIGTLLLAVSAISAHAQQAPDDSTPGQAVELAAGT
jgi:hypothetical protein